MGPTIRTCSLAVLALALVNPLRNGEVAREARRRGRHGQRESVSRKSLAPTGPSTASRFPSPFRGGLAAATLLALGLATISATVTPAWATPSALSSYARARLAASDEAGDEAVAAYQAALVAVPDDGSVALHAYREAVARGNKRLAIRAAQVLDVANVAPPDAVLLLFSASLAKADWQEAANLLGRIEREGSLAFLVPVLRGWTKFAARSDDPLAALNGRPYDGLASVYVREHRILLLLATKRAAEGLTAARAELATTSRGLSLRLAAAAQLDTLKAKAEALQLLQGDAAPLVAARQRVDSGKALGDAITSAPRGVATLFESVSRDLMRDAPSPAALTLARLAEFTASPSDQLRITLAQALSLSGKADAALGQLALIPATSLLAEPANDARILVLQRADRDAEALVLAKASAASGGARELARLGDAESQVGHFAEAATAYEGAIKRLTADKIGVSWNLWLLYGGALDAAKDWPRAKAALQKAVELGPLQPSALNHLGYAMIERGEDLDEATRLIAKASALRPDDPAITDSLGWAWFRRGDMSQAIPILEAAMAGNPALSEIAEHLGDAYWVAGRRVDARYSWRAALVQADASDEQTRLRDKIADGLSPTAK